MLSCIEKLNVNFNFKIAHIWTNAVLLKKAYFKKGLMYKFSIQDNIYLNKYQLKCICEKL